MRYGLKSQLLTVIICFPLAACTVGSDYKRPAVVAPAEFKELQEYSAETMPDGPARRQSLLVDEVSGGLFSAKNILTQSRRCNDMHQSRSLSFLR